MTVDVKQLNDGSLVYLDAEYKAVAAQYLQPPAGPRQKDWAVRPAYKVAEIVKVAKLRQRAKLEKSVNKKGKTLNRVQKNEPFMDHVIALMDEVNEED